MMINMEELLKHVSPDYTIHIDDEVSYSEKSLSTEFEIVKLTNGIIAYKIDDLWLTFYVMNFYSGDSEDEKYQLFWNDTGTLGSLRELRHSSFQEYVFYANLKLIEQASKWLQQYFD